jgi:hypothetical protein
LNKLNILSNDDSLRAVSQLWLAISTQAATLIAAPSRTWTAGVSPALSS